LTPLNIFSTNTGTTALKLGKDYLAVGFNDSSTVLYDLIEPLEK